MRVRDRRQMHESHMQCVRLDRSVLVPSAISFGAFLNDSNHTAVYPDCESKLCSVRFRKQQNQQHWHLYSFLCPPLNSEHRLTPKIPTKPKIISIKPMFSPSLLYISIRPACLMFYVLCIVILCLECFHCYVIIDCWLNLISCTFQLIVALINHLLTYLLISVRGD